MAAGLRSGEQYGPASYYALGATYPRDRLRKPYPRFERRFFPAVYEESEAATLYATSYPAIYGPNIFYATTTGPDATYPQLLGTTHHFPEVRGE